MIVLLKNFKNIFLISELRKKVFFTFGVFLVYRLGTHIPIPGVDTSALAEMIKSGSGMIGGLLPYIDMGCLLF